MSFSTAIDDVTFAALRRGCRRTQERVYHVYGRAAWTLAVRLSGCESTAWDVVQNSFIKVFTRIEQLDSPARFGGWLRQIVAREVVDGFRQKPEGLAPLPEGEDRVTEPAVLMDMERALSRLDATDRTVLWLHDAEGFKHGEIAALLGESVPWSKTRLSRVRARMRQLLGESHKSIGRSAANG